MTRQTYNFGFVLLIFFLSSIYIVVFSKSGILERKYLIRQNLIIENSNQHLLKKNRILFDHLQNLKKQQYTDQEILDAGYIIKPNRVLILKGLHTDDEQVLRHKNNKTKIKERITVISHYRMIVVVVSLLMLLLYYIRRPHGNDIKKFE